MRLVDFTRPLTPGMRVVPGDPPVTFAPAATHDVDGYQVTQVCLGSHSGTHLDAPRHFFPEGPALSDYPLERLVGTGLIIDIRPATGRDGGNGSRGGDDGLDERAGSDSRGRDGTSTVALDRLATALDLWRPTLGERVLLWSDGKTTLSEAGARLLLERGVGLIAIDGPSVESEENGSASGYPVHRLVLGAGVLMAENLCRLEEFGEGRVQCAFLPLALEGTDGAPVRAVGWR